MLVEPIYLEIIFWKNLIVKEVKKYLAHVLPKGHYGLLDSYFFQAASISNSGFPWVSGSPGGPTELDFKGSGCDPEVLGVLESKILKTWPNLTKKSHFPNSFWLLAPQKPQGCIQNP